MSDIENVGAGRKYPDAIREYEAEKGKYVGVVEQAPPTLPQDQFPKVPDPSPFVVG